MEKPFNKELFFELCEKYGVEFGKEYDGLKFKKQDGSIVDLTNDIIDEIFLGNQKKIKKGKLTNEILFNQSQKRISKPRSNQ